MGVPLNHPFYFWDPPCHWKPPATVLAILDYLLWKPPCLRNSPMIHPIYDIYGSPMTVESPMINHLPSMIYHNIHHPD